MDPEYPEASTAERLQTLITCLKLEPLPLEDGRFSIAYRSPPEIEAPDGSSAASSGIYYLLQRSDPQNHLHWLLPDDVHILIEGGPADYYLFLPDGSVQRHRMGRDLRAGERPLVHSPAGSWKAVRLASEADYLLVGSALSPCWSPERVKVGAGSEFIERYAGRAEWASAEFLQSLIGPNWRP